MSVHPRQFLILSLKLLASYEGYGIINQVTLCNFMHLMLIILCNNLSTTKQKYFCCYFLIFVPYDNKMLTLILLNLGYLIILDVTWRLPIDFASCFSLQLHIESSRCYMENMATSYWMTFKVTQYQPTSHA